MSHRLDAANILRAYFKSAFLAAGLMWSSDNGSEIDGAVDAIIRAAVEELQAQIVVAGGAKERTHQALVDADLLPATLTVEDVRQTAQSAFAHIAGALKALFDTPDLRGNYINAAVIVEQESIALDAFCGAPPRGEVAPDVFVRGMAAARATFATDGPLPFEDLEDA